MTSGTPYIGSKISLVSKAEIRYEGFLYTIDQNDSTVTLAKVISLGTEDRVPESPVPAREEVFEYIVFRGSDIKDLHVCEGPKRPKVEDPAIVHQSTHSYSQVNNPYYPRNYAPFGGGVPSFGYHPFNFHQSGPGGDISYVRRQTQTPPSLPRTPTPEPIISRDDRAMHKNQKQISNFQDGSRKIRSNESKYKDDTDHDGYTKENRDISINKVNKDNRNTYRYNDSRDRDIRDNRDRREFSDYNRYNNRNKDGRDNRVVKENKDNDDRKDQRYRDSKDFGDRRGSKDNSWKDYGDKKYREPREKDNRNVSRDYKEYTNRDYKPRYNYVKKENQEEKEEQRSTLEGGRGQSRGRGRSYGGRVSNARGLTRGGYTRTKFTEDFDFETANAKFNKEEIEKELLRVLKKVKIKDESGESSELKDVIEEKEVDDSAPLPSPDKFYDRSKSFFDSISCEAMVPKTDDEVMTRRQEQALNTETFGSSASRFRPGYRGRGRGRGRWRGRGRGGFYRGRGSFRGNSNRPWVDYEFDYEAAGIKSQQDKPIKVSAGES